MVEKARIKRLDNGTDIPVMFNPSSYNVVTTGQLAGEGTCLQFKRVNVDDFTVTLFFDTYEVKTDVREQIKAIAELVMPTVEGRKTKQPPVCLFIWGGFSYKGVIYKVDQKFTMFLDTGVPVRADVTVTFKSIITEKEDAAFSGKEACRKLWKVKSGDRLDLIAHSTLKDARQWRKIAEENKIADPLIFPTESDLGRSLIIPDL